MNLFGKLIAGLLGYLILGIPGLILGLLIGHLFDKGLAGIAADPRLSDPVYRAKIEASFFRLSFQMLGAMAKADGRVSEMELQAARALMQRMNLDEQRTAEAMTAFNAGKSPDFDLDAALNEFSEVVDKRKDLVAFLIQTLAVMAAADGHLDEAENEFLMQVGTRLGVSRAQLQMLLRMMAAQSGFHGQTRGGGQQGGYQGGGQQPPHVSEAERLEQAYWALGVSQNDSDATIKKAYRKLMSEHHPDKLAARGIPESMRALHTEKAKEISTAYELIKANRGMK
ncbi:co-chaperone DjlA [Allohahella marinimesophila]|uniref:Co-chaperone DjlA n=1 Tax=Allohahella marinimesophila TaxID=1054972 RepID=A0ABP7PIW0_9GAMM